jgi:hypothetical protein
MIVCGDASPRPADRRRPIAAAAREGPLALMRCARTGADDHIERHTLSTALRVFSCFGRF